MSCEYWESQIITAKCLEIWTERERQCFFTHFQQSYLKYDFDVLYVKTNKMINFFLIRRVVRQEKTNTVNKIQPGLCLLEFPFANSSASGLCQFARESITNATDRLSFTAEIYFLLILEAGSKM